ncbi:MAG TPA: histidine phosphatase family protein [Solirubrobacteraceae bacterium]|jgi:phosphohistidine phosphatase|nr:histidine phosphatase family protein [Solirubrobacteraceae bacterium]
MLWLLRHAEAAEGRPDEARPLTPRGIEQARIAGLALAQLGVTVEHCLSSPKRRAMETARLACEPLGIEITAEPAIAGSTYDPERLAAGLGETVLVGHNPSISNVLRDMTGVRAHLRKGGIAAVQRGELILLMTPTELAAIAGVTAA